MGEHDRPEDVSHDDADEPGPRETSDDATQSDAGLTGSPSFVATAGPAADVGADVDPDDVLDGGDDEDEPDGDEEE
ncbi:MAG: hypothetical protein KY469_19315 [Actinobacteria bacterium]|nr:hypothetical protein [Actinomycetota bacterium]